MADFLTGVFQEVTDASNLTSTAESGIYCLQGITPRGPVNLVDENSFITTADDFEEKYGFDPVNFPDTLLMRRFLENGGRCYFNRLAHYTDVTDPATIEGTKATATLTLASNSVVFTGKNIGTGFNGVKVTVSAAQSGATGKVDIKVEMGRFKPSPIRDVNVTPSASEKADINARLKYVDLGTITNQIPIGTVTLATGTQTVANIVDTDYNGSSGSGLGWYAFDNITDAFRFVNLSRHSPVVDIGLATYCIARGDVRFLIGGLVGAAWQNNLDYRNGTGTYSHTAIDTWLGDFSALPSMKVTNPKNSLQILTIDPMADLAAAFGRKDKVAEWYATAREEYNKMGSNNGITPNLGSPALQDAFNKLQLNQINAIIKDSDVGSSPVRYYGNRTLIKDQSKILKFSNVADFVMIVARTLKPLVKSSQFKPGTPKSWRDLYNRVKPYIDQWVKEEAIYEKKWIWQGDQFVKSIDDLGNGTLNQKADVSNGKYRWRFIFSPIVAIDLITGEIMPSDLVTFEGLISGAGFEFSAE